MLEALVLQPIEPLVLTDDRWPYRVVSSSHLFLSREG